MRACDSLRKALSFIQMSENKSVAFSLPLDVLVLIALAGGPSLVVAFAVAGSGMKRLLDQRYVISKRTRWEFISDDSLQRRFGVIGKLVNVHVTNLGCLMRLPSYVEELIVSAPCNNYPGPIVRLPESLRSLLFATHFRAPFDKFLWPDGVRHLSIGAFHASLLQKALPRDLDSLELISGVNQPLDNWIAHTSIRRLSIQVNGLPWNFVRFPPSLRQLILWMTSFTIVSDGLVLPYGLEELVLNNSLYFRLAGITFPPTLKRVSVQRNNNTDVEMMKSLGFDVDLMRDSHRIWFIRR